MRITELTIFIGILWLIELYNSGTSYSLSQWGIVPRTEIGLRGIPFWTFLHAGHNHLITNTVPLAVMAWFILLRGFKDFAVLTVGVTVIAGLMLWLLGRPAIHVGSSGLIFGYFAFLVAMGWHEQSFKSWFFAILTIVIYGGIIWGVVPQQGNVSWEGHLFGLLAGLLMARYLVRKPQASVKPGKNKRSS